MTEDVACWVEVANYDLDTARADFQAGRYVAVLVQCQQALEKILKALIVQNQGQMPPRVHNLPMLAQLAGVALTDEQNLFLERLFDRYFEARYPSDIEDFRRLDVAETARRHLAETEELYRWLLQQIT